MKLATWVTGLLLSGCVMAGSEAWAQAPAPVPAEAPAPSQQAEPASQRDDAALNQAAPVEEDDGEAAPDSGGDKVKPDE